MVSGWDYGLYVQSHSKRMMALTMMVTVAAVGAHNDRECIRYQGLQRRRYSGGNKLQV